MADARIDLGRLLEESGAILHGHFRLTSGRHSAVYFEKFRVLERPDVLSALCAEIAAFARELRIDAVAGPTTGGIIIAFEVARQLNLPAIYVESENGVKTLRRGKTLPLGQRVLIVDDVLTSGTSLEETAAAIRAAGGEPIAFAVLINRSDRTDWPVPLFGAYRVLAESFAPDEVPAWLAEIPIQQPGTRKIDAQSGTN
jgi:orotate phosphoribosyltransferase